MYKLAKPSFIKVITPLHAGSGQDLGIVDMPIQRERHTEFPKIEGSGLKGSIRDVFEKLNEIKIGKNHIEDKKDKEEKGKAISLSFGPKEGEAHSGALGFTDARLLFFPVKSMKGVFAWITCPMVLSRFKEDLEVCKIPVNFNPPEIKSGNCIVFDDNKISLNNNVVLEEYAFSIDENNTNNSSVTELINKIPYHDEILKQLVVLSDDDFRDFVNLSTEVITRTKINPETGTVQQGALFTEEYLPAESILYSLTLTTPIFNENKGKYDFLKDNKKEEEKLVMEFFEQNIPSIIQIGGNATIGKGIVEIKKLQGENHE